MWLKVAHLATHTNMFVLPDTVTNLSNEFLAFITKTYFTISSLLSSWFVRLIRWIYYRHAQLQKLFDLLDQLCMTLKRSSTSRNLYSTKTTIEHNLLINLKKMGVHLLWHKNAYTLTKPQLLLIFKKLGWDHLCAIFSCVSSTRTLAPVTDNFAKQPCFDNMRLVATFTFAALQKCPLRMLHV